MHRIRGAARATLAAVTMALLLSSCGGSSTPSGQKSSASAGGASFAQLQRRVDDAKRIPSFTYAGKPIDARAIASGKTVVNVPWGTAVDYPVLIAKQMAKAAAEVGLAWQTASVDGPDQWAQAMDNAVAKNPTLISLLIADPRAVRPQTQEALRRGIEVSSLHFWDSSQSALAARERLTSWVGIDYLKPARMLADWTIADSKGKANVLIIGGPDFTFNDPVVKTMAAEYRTYCPGCTYKVDNIPAADWASKIPSTVVAEAQTNPNLSYVIPFSDGAATNVVDGLRQANAQHVKIAGYGAAPVILDMVRKGQVAFDCGYSVAWSGYAFVDQLLRTLARDPVDTDVKNGLRCFDRSNVAETGNPAVAGQGFGDAYLTGYHKLWGLSR